MHDENPCGATVCLREPSGNHCGNNSLAESDHIREEKSTITTKHLVALYDSIALILQVHYARRKFHRKIVFCLFAEYVNQDSHEEFKRRGSCPKMRLTSCLCYVFIRDRDSIRP